VAERAAVDAPLGELLASSTGQGLLRLAAGVLATTVAAALLAVGPTQRPADSARPPPGARSLRWGGWRLVLVGATAGGTMLLQVAAGHAAGPSALRPLNLLAQWVHLLAVGAWVGGLVWLLAGLGGRQRPDQVRVVVGFSKLAAPVLAVVVVTGLARAVDLAGGWRGLVDSSYGRLLDLKVLLVAGLVALGALNRYRAVPAVARSASSGLQQPHASTPDPEGTEGHEQASDDGLDDPAADRGRRLGALRRNVRGEVIVAVGVLAVTAVLSQLPPGKFVVDQAAARPAPPPSVQVQGSDFATSVRLVLTVSPGTAGPNTFTAKLTDYDTGADRPASRVALRFTPRDHPDIGAATLELARTDGGLWRGQGSPLSIDGRWAVVALVEGPGAAVTVPLQLQTRPAAQRVAVSRVPGQPTLYTITLIAGGTLQAYVDPGRPGANTVHFTFFTLSGDEQPIRTARASMTTSSGANRALKLLRLGPGHFAANVDLRPGRASFAINATTSGGQQHGGQFEQPIE
jgi:putative copper export protein